MTKKFFRAVSRTDPEDVVDFDLGDIYSIHNRHLSNGIISAETHSSSVCISTFYFKTCETKWLGDWLKDYTLYHLEQGEAGASYVLHHQEGERSGGGR